MTTTFSDTPDIYTVLNGRLGSIPRFISTELGHNLFYEIHSTKEYRIYV
jgi:hypothetical protein